MADPNTRQGKRTPVTLKIKFKSETLEQFIERYAVDVSQGGIFIRTKEPLAVGTQMRFEFQLRDASPLIGGEGTVVWTRENDPSRPAIAPGMGVRFDRLADGSQVVLERILAEKAKQAPQRGPDSVTKPPLFTDTPTRVAPPPVQDQLLGQDSRRNKRVSNEPFNDQQTPLPKPMPFHSDADEFPEEAFEEATKVRALDDLIAQTAPESSDAPPIGTSTEPDLFGNRDKDRAVVAGGLDELAARRGRVDATENDAPEPPAPKPIGIARTPSTSTPPASIPATLDPSSTSPGFASGRSSEKSLEQLAGGALLGGDRESAPNLPSPPTVEPNRASRVTPAPQPRLLDTTPSPRTESAATEAAMEKMAKTKLGLEPVLVPTRPNLPGSSGSAAVIKDAPTKPSGMHAVSASTEPTSSVRMPKKSSVVPIIILLLLLVAASGAAVWFFVLREKAAPKVVDNGSGAGTGSANPVGSNNGSNGSGSAGSGSDHVAVENGSGSGKGSDNTPPPPKAEPVEIEITSSIPKATVEIVGTDLKGPAPFKTKLDKDKPYKVRISAPGYATLEKDVTGGTAKLPITLDPKPRALDIKTEPSGALIIVENKVIPSKLTPQLITLEPALAARKAIRVGVRLNGYRPVDKMIDASAFTESDDKLLATVTVKLDRLPVIRPPVGPGSGSGSAGSAGSGTEPPPGDGSGSASTPPPPPPPPVGSGGGGGSAEPTPDFVKDKQP